MLFARTCVLFSLNCSLCESINIIRDMNIYLFYSLRTMPELNWSISREDTPPRDLDKKQFRGSQSTSRLLPEQETVKHVTRHATTSQLPSYQRSNSTDSSSSGDSQTKRRKNFEAFVMTGDRMINLAKTPANVDFQSKYYKPDAHTAVKSLGDQFKDKTETSQDDFSDVQPLVNSSLPSSPVEDNSRSEHNHTYKQNVCTYFNLKFLYPYLGQGSVATPPPSYQ